MPRKPLPERCCASCMFFRPNASESGVMAEPGGDCHRMPPQVMNDGEDLYSVWPMVLDEDSCGEWRPHIN